jgi:hypothetical protein
MAITGGLLLNSVPAAQKMTLATNYLDLASASNAGWSQQYLPDLMAQEAEVFGNRTIAGFLSQVGAEEAMQADQVVWSEQGRLHISLKGTTDVSGNLFTVTADIDSAAGFTVASHGVRISDMVLISQSTGTELFMVTQVDGVSITCEPYEFATMTTALTSDSSAGGARLLVVGSEYSKGSKGQGSAVPTAGGKSNQPTFKSFSNKPIIIKDYYEVNGSDVSQVGWVETSSEEGQSGYLWYLKAEGETRMRFTDYLEMSMLEVVKGTTSPNSNIDATFTGTAAQASNDISDPFGSEGLFAAIKSRGNITTGVTGVNAATDLAEFDAILAEFDKQGAIEENMMFVNRATSLAMDDMLASMNSYGAGGTSYGVFDNSEDMALNLGFSGFRRGSYDFYKSDFRYLNDRSTRGGLNAVNTADSIRGVIIPAGTSTVYDQMLGKNLKRPFLHVRYRASQTDDRKLKTWVTGSVGAATSDLDAMQINYLSERCLVTQGANNFMLMK